MKSFIVITESKRKAGRIVGDLYEIKNNKPIRISGFGFNIKSNAGIRREVTKALVTFGALPQQVLTKEFGEAALPDYQIMIVEGQGFNYVETITGL